MTIHEIDSNHKDDGGELSNIVFKVNKIKFKLFIDEYQRLPWSVSLSRWMYCCVKQPFWVDQYSTAFIRLHSEEAIFVRIRWARQNSPLG